MRLADIRLRHDLAVAVRPRYGEVRLVLVPERMRAARESSLGALLVRGFGPALRYFRTSMREWRRVVDLLQGGPGAEHVR